MQLITAILYGNSGQKWFDVTTHTHTCTPHSQHTDSGRASSACLVGYLLDLFLGLVCAVWRICVGFPCVEFKLPLTTTAGRHHTEAMPHTEAAYTLPIKQRTTQTRYAHAHAFTVKQNKNVRGGFHFVHVKWLRWCASKLFTCG